MEAGVKGFGKMKGVVLCSVMFVGLAAILGYASSNGFGANSPSFAPLTITNERAFQSAPVTRAEVMIPKASPEPVKHVRHRKIEPNKTAADPTPDQVVESAPPTTVVTAPESTPIREPKRRVETPRVTRQVVRRTPKKVEPKTEIAKADIPAVEVRPAPVLVPPTHTGKDVTSG